MDLPINSEHRLRSENLSWDLDVWYPRLKEFTFKTVFIPLTSQERDAIIRFNEVSWKNVDCKNKLTKAEINTLLVLEKEIDEKIKENFNENGGFIRLCGRSPKDAEPLHPDKFYARFKEEYQKLLSSGFKQNIHTKMCAISRTPLMQIKSGEEAMALLLSSERVFSDMLDWRNFGEPEQICLREFQKELTIDYEFRVFIYDNNLTAISQYDHHSFYPHLYDIKDLIFEKIKKKWESFHSTIQTRNYAADFGFIPSTQEIVLVEMSPFFPCTGGSLFSWSADFEILKGKNLPKVEFRLKKEEEVHPQLEELVDINWDYRWQHPQSNYKTWFVYEETKLEEVNPSNNGKHFLFVYGTLKRGFQWNQKYLSERVGGKFVSPAVTIDKFPLFVGDSGVPYLVYGKHENGKTIKGELWEINELCLKGLDEYEGIGKGYYSREKILVKLKDESKKEAFLYVLCDPNFELSSDLFIEEYTLDMHEKMYNAINHIQVKQLNYFKRPSDWGKIDSKKVEEINTFNPKN